MAVVLNDGDVERIREHLARGRALEAARDAPVVWTWAKQALADLETLLEQVDATNAAEGGAFARRLREALEERILRELNGRAALTTDTRAESLGVHVLPTGVVVDVRLVLGTWKQ